MVRTFCFDRSTSFAPPCISKQAHRLHHACAYISPAIANAPLIARGTQFQHCSVAMQTPAATSVSPRRVLVTWQNRAKFYCTPQYRNTGTSDLACQSLALLLLLGVWELGVDDAWSERDILVSRPEQHGL
eukprot:jgi/Ulvmu1/8314/UM042_0020.1